MIDYKEFCDRFWLAANDKEQQQLYSYRFGKKSFFARSNWLSSDLSVSEPRAEEEDFSMGENISIISAKASKLKSETVVETARKMPTASKLGLSLGDLSTTFSAGAKISLNTRHMADLSIESAKLLPKELEEGKQHNNSPHTSPLTLCHTIPHYSSTPISLSLSNLDSTITPTFFLSPFLYPSQAYGHLTINYLITGWWKSCSK